MDTESLQIIREDLEFLRDQWGPEMPDPDIRRGSATLRRLLVEGTYSQAWRFSGFEKEPHLVAVDIMASIGDANLAHVEFALAWGAHFRGMNMSSTIIAHDPNLAVPPDPITEDGYPGEREYSLSEFLESPSGFADGKPVCRREFIKYVANIKGGVHLGQKTRSKEREMIKRVAKFEKRATANTTDGILVEIVSIAQAVARSDDAKKLISAIQATS